MSSPAHFDRHETPPFARDSHGVLVRRFHSDRGPIVFTGQTHQDFPAALKELTLTDPDRELLSCMSGEHGLAWYVLARVGGLALATLAVVGLVSILLAG
jgi:hypothetical protein